MTTAEVLKAAREKISKPENWTKSYSARDSADRPVRYENSTACKFCMIGAVEAVKREHGAHVWCYHRLQFALPPGDWDHSVGGFNDDPNTKHEDVLAVFDRAIAAAEQATA